MIIVTQWATQMLNKHKMWWFYKKTIMYLKSWHFLYVFNVTKRFVTIDILDDIKVLKPMELSMQTNTHP